MKVLLPHQGTKVRTDCVFRRLFLQKLLTCFLVLGVLQLNATTFSQGITLEETRAPFESVLQKIGRQGGYQFLYNNEVIRNARPVTIRVTNQSIETVLELCFRNQPFTYELRDRTILIKPLPDDTHGRSSEHMLQERVDIEGRVTDGAGEPLPGASVVVRGTSTGTVTDADGNFRLRQVSPDAVLVVSFIGYTSMELPVDVSRSVYEIALKPSTASLEEVVVVGYGTQERAKVTGAVSQVGTEVFETRPITNVAQGLQGAIPNLNITFGDGEPHRGGTFNLRGFTSINGGGPLILIDGTPGDINLVNPEDVETVTVLKDAASAAIYGARASFGVVLVTTKRSKSTRPVIRYTSNFGWGKPTRRPEIVEDPLYAARFINDAYRGFSGADAPGMPAIIDYLEQREADPSLPEIYIDPSGNFINGARVNWYDEFYNEGAPYTKNYLSVSGREARTGYFLSVGYNTQDGLFRVATDKYKRTSLRLKLDNQTTDWLNIYNNLEISKGIYDRPNKEVSDGGYTVYRYLSLYANPWNAIRTANGNYTIAGMTTFGQLQDAGRSVLTDQLLKNTLGFRTEFFDNTFRVNGDYTYFARQGYDEVQYNRLEYEARADNVVEWTNPDYYASGFAENLHEIINLYGEYERNVGQHHFKLLAGFNQELYRAKRFSARRDENLTPELQSLNLTTGEAIIADSKSEWALRGFFGRFNYDFRNRYLLEINARYDGTSRFPASDRWGFFPSVSAGWVVSEEDFYKSLLPSSTFKLRGSYGSLGNQQVATYAYINSMSVSRSSNILDGELPLATSAPALSPHNLTWETARTFNLGFDFGMFDDRLQAGFDWYRRETINMLTKGMTMPAVLGTGEPRQNAADLVTKGWEVSLSWNDQLGSQSNGFRYYARAVLSDNRSWITRYDNPNKFLGDYYEGMEIGEVWGFNTLGFFKTDDEYESHADQSRVQGIVYSFSGDGHPLAGDLKFEDINNDGFIDHGENTRDNPGDRRIIGNTTPRYAYGLNVGFSWKNFNVDVFLQGIGKRDFWPGAESAVFWGFYNRWNQPFMKHIDGNYWTPENPDAYFPRPRAYMAFDNTRSLGIVQTRYLQDASYMRLKNLAIGYTLPRHITERVKLDRVNVFFAGANLLELTKISPAFDPEGLEEDPDAGRANGNGFIYPLQRTYTFGIEISL